MNNKTSWFGHSTSNGKNQNRVFDPGGNSPFDGRETNNKGAMQMTTAQQPTCRTRHTDMKQFVILQWSEEDLISFTDCPSALLVADYMMKQTARPNFMSTWISSWDEEDRSFRPRTSVQSMFFLLLTIFVSFANKTVSSMAE